MLRGRFDSAGEGSWEELRAAYDEELVSVVERVGEDTVRAETDVDDEVLSALVSGDSPEITLETAAAVLELDDDFPDAETIAMEARDILLMGMSMAVLDVEAVAAGLDDALDPKEIQQKAEGRFPMTLDEYARVHNYIEHRKR